MPAAHLGRPASGILGQVQPGPDDAITDIDGVLVGHCTREEPGWLTGVTVVVAPPGTVGGVDVRGVSTGLYAAGRGWPVGPGSHERVPIVPAAILFDLGRGGTWLNHPRPGDGAAAFAAAGAGPVEQGSVGAGTGARTGGLRGGVGTASAVLSSGVTVGALVVVNAVGEPFGPDGRMLAAHLAADLDLPTPDAGLVTSYREARAAAVAALRAGTATTLAVVATDATLSKAGCSKLAGVAHDGFARALSPVHTAFDGDTVFAPATGARPGVSGLDEVDLQTAAADCVARAIVRGVLAATSVDRTAEGGLALASYRDAIIGD